MARVRPSIARPVLEVVGIGVDVSAGMVGSEVAGVSEVTEVCEGADALTVDEDDSGTIASVV